MRRFFTILQVVGLLLMALAIAVPVLLFVIFLLLSGLQWTMRAF